MAFRPLWNSDHAVVSVSIDFPSYSQWNATFHHIGYGYSCADWNGFHDHLRDVRWDNIFKLSASAASEFCDWVHVGIEVYIHYRKYQVKHHSSLWFSSACVTAIVDRNHFFYLYRKDRFSKSKVKFRQASYCSKKVHETAKLAYANKTRDSITSRNQALAAFSKLPIVLSAKVNLLYLFY